MEPSLEPLLKSRSSELALTSFFYVDSNLVPRVMGRYDVRQTQPRSLVRLYYLWEVAWYPRGRRLRQTHPLPFITQARHSHGRIGDCLSRFIPLDPLCSARQGHLSYDVAFHHAQTVLSGEKLYIHIYLPWRIAKSPLQAITVASR
jgi:hypothetical protein